MSLGYDIGHGDETRSCLSYRDEGTCANKDVLHDGHFFKSRNDFDGDSLESEVLLVESDRDGLAGVW